MPITDLNLKTGSIQSTSVNYTKLIRTMKFTRGDHHHLYKVHDDQNPCTVHRTSLILEVQYFKTIKGKRIMIICLYIIMKISYASIGFFERCQIS